jgi:hypothetical protein
MAHACVTAVARSKWLRWFRGCMIADSATRSDMQCWLCAVLCGLCADFAWQMEEVLGGGSYIVHVGVGKVRDAAGVRHSCCCWGCATRRPVLCA